MGLERCDSEIAEPLRGAEIDLTCQRQNTLVTDDGGRNTELSHRAPWVRATMQLISQRQSRGAIRAARDLGI